MKFFLVLILSLSCNGIVNCQFMQSAKNKRSVIVTLYTKAPARFIILSMSIITILDAFLGAIRVMRGTMSKKVSLYMLDVMQGIKEGRIYILRGDLGYGLEESRDSIKSKTKTCKSLSPLMRKGLIEFVVSPTDMSRYYRVRLTPEGVMLLKKELK